MTDRELLELAAKAADILALPMYGEETGELHTADMQPWNPLRNDGDALRLVVKLGLHIECNTKVLGDTLVSTPTTDVLEIHNDDPYAATRRAIVRAAAEIGKEIK